MTIDCGEIMATNHLKLDDPSYHDSMRNLERRARQYADMSLEDLLEQMFGFAYEAGRTILVGERDKPALDPFDYMKMSFYGVILTICLILSFWESEPFPPSRSVCWL